MYNLASFCELNIGSNQRYHRIDFNTGERAVGTLAGVIDGRTFTSGYSAGFGGPDFRRDTERLEVMLDMVEYCATKLIGMGINTLVIRAKPQHYSECEALLHFALLRQGFAITDATLNSFLDLTRFGSTDHYVASLKSSARRELRPALRREHVWRRAQSEQEWRAGYEALRENRERIHSANLSLSYPYLVRMRKNIRDRMEMFLLQAEGGIIAASLVYRIRRGQSQVMYWGDRTRGSYPGVMNLLAFHTVRTGIEEGLHAIDLGPSASFNQESFGGLAFKHSIGAVANMRYTFRRSLYPKICTAPN
jgi:hypothetical protein